MPPANAITPEAKKSFSPVPGRALQKKDILQRKASSQQTPSSVPPIVNDVLQSPGQPLDEATRSFFEPRFAHDFSQVRVHADSQAAESARSMNAVAYTVGRDVVFNSGQYSPHTSAGKQLLAHEMAHVVQQSNPGSAGTIGALEAEAHTSSTRALVSHRVSIGGAANPGTIQRQEIEMDDRAIQIIAKENGRIAVVMTRKGKIIQGYAEIVPPPGVSATDAVNQGLVRAYTTEVAAQSKVTVIVPPSWSRHQPVDPDAKVDVKDEEQDRRDRQQAELQAKRKEKADKMRELYRQYLADFDFQDRTFGTIISHYESPYGNPADMKTDDQILALQGDQFFFQWMQQRRAKSEWQAFQGEAQAGGYTDSEGIKEMWKEYRQPGLAKKQQQEQELHELKYDTENALQRAYAKPVLLKWMASQPKPVMMSSDKGTVKMYMLPLPDGNFATLNETQYLKLRQIAKDKIETDLNRIQSEKDGYQFRKNDRGVVGKALDAVAGADLEGKTWKGIEKSVKAGRDALDKDNLEASLAYIEEAEKQNAVARKEMDRYLHRREVAGEVWIQGLETVKVTSEVILAIGTANPELGAAGLIIVTGKGVTETVALAAVQQAGGKHVDWRDTGFDVGVQVATALATRGLGKLQALGPKNPIMNMMRESFGGQLTTEIVESVLIDSATYAAKQAYQEARGRGEKFTAQDFMNHFTKYLSDPRGLPLDVIKAQATRYAGRQAAKFTAKHGIPLGTGKAEARKHAPSEQPPSPGPIPKEGTAAKAIAPVVEPEKPLDVGKGPPKGEAGQLPSIQLENGGKAPSVLQSKQKGTLSIEISGIGTQGKSVAPRKSSDRVTPVPVSNQAKRSQGTLANGAKQLVEPVDTVPESGVRQKGGGTLSSEPSAQQVSANPSTKKSRSAAKRSQDTVVEVAKLEVARSKRPAVSETRKAMEANLDKQALEHAGTVTELPRRKGGSPPPSEPSAQQVPPNPSAKKSSSSAKRSQDTVTDMTRSKRPALTERTKTLRANLDKQSPEQVGTVTELPRRKGGSPPPSEPSAQQVPTVAAEVTKIAVGQTHSVEEGQVRVADLDTTRASASTGGRGGQDGGVAVTRMKPASRRPQSSTTRRTAKKASGPSRKKSSSPAKKPPAEENSWPRMDELADLDFKKMAAEQEPLVAVRVQDGGSARKSTFWEEGTPQFKAAATNKRFHVMPKSEAEALGFRPGGTAYDQTIKPYVRDGVQVESYGAGTGKGNKHNVTARANVQGDKVETNNRAFEKTIGASRREAHGYKHLLDNKELGVIRPGNASTGGVDSITASVPQDGKAKVYLNDFTSSNTRKGAKPTHKSWVSELGAAVSDKRFGFGNQKTDNAIRNAILNDEVYVRTVRVDYTKNGPVVTIEPPRKVEVPKAVKRALEAGIQ